MVSDAWQDRELEHIAELDRAKKKAYNLGFEDGRRKGYADGRAEAENQGLMEGSLDSHVEGYMENISPTEHDNLMPASVRMFMEEAGFQDAGVAAEVLGWTGKGDAVEYIENFQKTSSPAWGYILANPEQANPSIVTSDD